MFSIINIILLFFFLLSIYYTIKYKFVQRKTFSKIKEVFFKERNKSAYQSFIVALGSHIGVGNIIGVTTALIYGGPGSIFWMVIFAIFSSIFSLMENTLAVKYRTIINNENRGGSSYYIYYGLKKKIIAVIIAVFLLITSGVIFQSIQINSISESINIVFGVKKELIFLFLVLFTIFFIFTGTKKIVSFSEIIVPIMSIGYLFITLYAITINIKKLPEVLINIISSAFNFKSAIAGGLFVGIKRSLFSHEAGLGSMPTISAMSEIDKPINQGYAQVMGVFIDTVVMCTLTGLMILVYDVDLLLFTGYDLIIYSFENIFGSIGEYFACFFMVTFALATVVSQYYLGESNLLFLSNKKKMKRNTFLYQCMFILGITVGVFSPLNKIWDLIDYGMIGIGVLNIYALIRLEKEFRNELFLEKN